MLLTVSLLCNVAHSVQEQACRTTTDELHFGDLSQLTCNQLVDVCLWLTSKMERLWDAFTAQVGGVSAAACLQRDQCRTCLI